MYIFIFYFLSIFILTFTAYEIIRMLNAELKEKGYIVVRGKVNTKYFFKKLIYNEE